MNRLWWMASAVVLLFVALAVTPVAAYDWLSNNKTFIPVNDIRFNNHGNGTYYFNLTTVPGEDKALHISTSNASPLGQCTEITNGSRTGTFYITDTGGRQYQDDVILLIGVSSANYTALNDFKIDISAEGYYWDPVYDGPSKSQSPPLEYIHWKAPAIDKQYTSEHFLNDTSGVNISQSWKFAPTENYPLYCGQSVGTEKFNLTLIDLNVGVISNSSYKSTLNNTGAVKVDYDLIGPSAFGEDTPGIVVFNAYAYNNYTTQGPKMVNWINRVNTSASVPDVNASGWKIIGFS